MEGGRGSLGGFNRVDNTGRWGQAVGAFSRTILPGLQEYPVEKPIAGRIFGSNQAHRKRPTWLYLTQFF